MPAKAQSLHSDRRLYSDIERMPEWSPLLERVKFVQCPNPWCTERLSERMMAEHELVCRRMHENEMARRATTHQLRTEQRNSPLAFV